MKFPWLRQRGRNDRKRDRALRRQEVDAIGVNGDRQRGTLRFEIGDQIAKRRRIQHRARQQVGSRLSRLLEHGYRQRLAAVLLLQLREPQRRGHPGRSTADDQNVYFECFAAHGVLTTKVTKDRRPRRKTPNQY